MRHFLIIGTTTTKTGISPKWKDVDPRPQTKMGKRSKKLYNPIKIYGYIYIKQLIIRKNELEQNI